MIFQDPISSLNPRRKVRDIVMEPLTIWKRGIEARSAASSSTGRSRRSASTRPRAAESQAHQFSGGQCQRISIARSLVLDPSLIICDEPVSALDVSVQAQVLNLLEDLKARHGLTLIFIAHDLAVVKNISDRVAVMYLGKLCEVAPSDDLYAAPMHPYTNVLLASIPVPDPDVARRRRSEVVGEPPSPVLPPRGCRFHPRCPSATEECTTTEPQLRELRPGPLRRLPPPGRPTRRSPSTSRPPRRPTAPRPTARTYGRRRDAPHRTVRAHRTRVDPGDLRRRRPRRDEPGARRRDAGPRSPAGASTTSTPRRRTARRRTACGRGWPTTATTCSSPPRPASAPVTRPAPSSSARCSGWTSTTST